jgi:hypothetical protein
MILTTNLLNKTDIFNTNLNSLIHKHCLQVENYVIIVKEYLDLDCSLLSGLLTSTNCFITLSERSTSRCVSGRGEYPEC